MAKIFINPGHAPLTNVYDDIYNGYRADPGACSPRTGLKEAAVCQVIGKKVEEYLNAAGFATESIQYDDLGVIANTANASDSDLFVSIHCNAAGNYSAQGAETWYFQGSGRSQKLASCIQNQLANSMPITDRGIKSTTGLYVLKHTDMPAALVELAFITNEYDESLLSDMHYQDEFSRAVARGISDYFQ